MYQIVLCNCPNNEVATTIAKRLVGDKLAACVNIIANVSSVYRWQDNIEIDNEVTLLIKSKTSLFSEIEQCIESIHPYDVCEIIAIDINQGNPLYLNWLKESVK
ncbi:divalent-cation tolerance protein CutA [Thalassotalea maritima]|uniref:divalent-cation tolerance protein CutA n=1 Tax=Thalassotalea maritima TaxID=3242416 RepID=UPI003528D003